jgi:hypothetical protein
MEAEGIPCPEAIDVPSRPEGLADHIEREGPFAFSFSRKGSARANVGAIFAISSKNLVWSITFTLAFLFYRLGFKSVARRKEFHGRACPISRQRKDAR